MTKTAYLPTANLEPVQELLAADETVRAECMEACARYGDNQKMRVAFSAERNPDGRGKLSYHGRAHCVGLYLNPVVLSKDEWLPVLGPTEETKRQKMALIAERRSHLPFLGNWIDRWTASGVLIHASIFILFPGATVTAHYGATDQIVRVHTCVQENQACAFHTEFDKPRGWHVGQPFCFDDYAAKHWVLFPEEAVEQHPRIVLSTDFTRAYFKTRNPGHETLA